MDGPPAQSLGVEPVDPRIMTLPPRSRNARVRTKRLIRRVLTSASIIMLGTLAIYIHEMGDEDRMSALPGSTAGGKVSSSNTVTRRDTTMTLTTFVLFDMFNELSCRSESKS